MSNNLEELKKPQIPDEQIRRQAVNSLRGYLYQIYQTLNAWLTLKKDETLLLEVAEDFAVIAKNALEATQVKDTAGSGSVTLKTKSVADTIKALWEFQQANPNRNVCITYLTTSKIGKERGVTFPGNHSGLAYWRVAAREGTDVEPLRQVLLRLNLPSEITDFIKGSIPEDLRERILRQIKWVCDEKDIEGLEKTILERLIYFGDQKGCSPTDSKKARDSLIYAILEKIVQGSDRQLSRADFLCIFEKATSISIPMAQVRELLTRNILAANQGSLVGTISAVGSVLNASRIPLPSRVLDRLSLVEELVSDMGQLGAMWLHGSSGTGKTILVQFIARQSKYDWLLVPLRGCSSTSELDFRLCSVLQTSQSSRIGGVILDDFPTKYAHGVRLRLSMLVNEIHRMDGSVIVTSAKPPSPSLQGCFGESGTTVVNVPYLSQDEVAELVKLAGGDAQKWSGVVHSFYGPGHPQLVQARISGLQQRNWADTELLAEISGVEVTEIKDEREYIRERLFAELTQNIRDLLYRLSFFVGYFDRELAIAVGEVDPVINCPGEALDILIGPWIEVMANDRFRVSPLVSNAGIKTLSKSIQKEIRKRIVDNLIARHPFPGDFLGTLLSHALISRHVQGLTWLIMAITHTPVNDRRMIAEHLFVLPLLDTSQPLFKENINLSAMLRLAQFRVTAWANKTEYLPAIADQLITEARMLDNKEIADGFRYLAITSILVEQSLRISPRKWMPLIRDIEHLLNGQGDMIEYIRELDITKKGLNGWSVPQFLFAAKASSLKSINELFELFTELDRLEENHRSLLLSSLEAVPHGKRLMIEAAWLAEMMEKTLDGIKAAEKFRQLAEIAGRWGNTDIAVECECARAVMLDEYANDSDSALVSLDEAEEKYPNQVRLARQRASVHYRRNDYPAALAIIERIANIIPKENHIERAFVLREAGISASAVEIGDFDKASHFFSEACEAASNASDNMRPMAIGLKGDQAVAQFKLGEKGEALNLMHQAIIESEQLNPEAGKNEKYCTLILGHIILWMQTQVKDDHLSEKDFTIFPGCCSNPDPSEKIMERASPPMLVYWYHLAVLEVMLGMNIGVLDELRARTCTQRIKSCELVLNRYLMEKYIISIDVDNFFSYLPEYIVKAAHMREHLKSVQAENIYDFMSNDFPPLQPDDWKNEAYLWMAKDAILALAAIVVCSHVSNFHEKLQNHVGRMENANTALGPFMECFKKQPLHSGDVYEVAASCLGRLMGKEVFVNPDDMFIITFRIWEWLSQTNFKNTVENMLADYFVESWRNIMTNQRFNLKLSMMTVPDIEDALKEPTKGLEKIAAIVVAAENAVKHKLDDTLREKLKKTKKQ